MSEEEKKATENKPNEEGQILVDEHIRIFDPSTGEELVNKRES
jgi:hypothetical protein